MGKSKRKKLTKQITSHQRISFVRSFMLVAITLVMLACFGLCIINSLPQYTIGDIVFYQNFAFGAFGFITGFLMGENATRK